MDRVLITHGTDTIIKTAEFLARKFYNCDKFIVLTASYKPERFKDSDAGK